jgi:hypothetical protein
LVRTYITFLKGYDAGFPKNFKLSGNVGIGKKINEKLVYTGGAVGVWTVHLFSSTDFDEIIIFGLSKDQTFKE